MHCPSKLQPGVFDNPGHVVDVLPTLMKMIGRSIPGNIDGIDVLTSAPDREIVHLLRGSPESYRGAIRKGEWKLHKVKTKELYNMISDPYEGINRYDTEPEIKNSLLERMRELAKFVVPDPDPNYHPPHGPPPYYRFPRYWGESRSINLTYTAELPETTGELLGYPIDFKPYNILSLTADQERMINEKN